MRLPNTMPRPRFLRSTAMNPSLKVLKKFAQPLDKRQQEGDDDRDKCGHVHEGNRRQNWQLNTTLDGWLGHDLPARWTCPRRLQGCAAQWTGLVAHSGDFTQGE